MAKTVKVGDKVSWSSSGGESTGKVVKKQTKPTQIKGHKVAASKDEPQYIVKSDKSGRKRRTRRSRCARPETFWPDPERAFREELPCSCAVSMAKDHSNLWQGDPQ